MPMTPRANMPHGVLRTIPTSRKTTDPSTSARAVRPAVPDMAKAGLRGLTGPSGRPRSSFGGYGGERSAAEDRPRPYGKKPFGAPKYGREPGLRQQIRRPSSGSSAPTASRRGISVTANVRGRRNVTVRSPRADSSATIAAARFGPRAIPAIIPTCRREKSA